MTGTYVADGSITDERDFEAALTEVVEQAIEADVDVRGAWEFETAGSITRWEVQVFEIASRADPDDRT